MNKEEEWRDVDGYAGLYRVSSCGNIESVRRETQFMRSGKQSSMMSGGRNLTLRKTQTGYSIVGLTKNASQRSKTIHRMVATAFIPNPLGKREVNHKNGIKADNRVENLEWVTHSENVLHSYRCLNKRNGGSEKQRVLQLDGDRTIAIHESMRSAGRAVNRNRSAIYNSCVKGHLCAGFRFKYATKNQAI